MTTVQIIGVSVAGAAVLLLIIALIVTRRRRADNEEDQVRPGPSFLDEAPQDTFSVLGKAEQPIEDITLDPAVQRAAESEQATAAERAREQHRPPPGGLGLARAFTCTDGGLHPRGKPGRGRDHRCRGAQRLADQRVPAERASQLLGPFQPLHAQFRLGRRQFAVQQGRQLFVQRVSHCGCSP